MSSLQLLGPRTVIYPAPDLAAAKQWWTQVLGQEPYFDQPFYVGFEVAGYELGLDPNGDTADGPITYWGVEDVNVAVTHLLYAGATEHTAPREVGDGIVVAVVKTPEGSPLGVIFNPHFGA